MIKTKGKFNWTKQRIAAAKEFAEGYTVKEVAKRLNVPGPTLYRWQNTYEFITEVDRLTLMIGIASKSERIRIAKRVIRQEMMGDIIITKKDVLEWIKFASDETDEVRLNLADLIGSFLAAKREDAESLSESGPDGSDAADPGE